MSTRVVRLVTTMSLLLCCVPAFAQTAAPSSASVNPAAVFVFADRTDRHAKYSKSEVFHALLDDTLSFLRENHLSMAVDEFAGRTYSENQTPIETILNMARDAHATSVLHLNVDRPISKWMKVSVRCYDINGKLLWEDKAESGGGFSGEHGLSVTKERLRALLQKRLGQDGLPLLAASTVKPAAPPNASEPQK
jgi:hypothetical protein